MPSETAQGLLGLTLNKQSMRSLLHLFWEVPLYTRSSQRQEILKKLAAAVQVVMDTTPRYCCSCAGDNGYNTKILPPPRRHPYKESYNGSKRLGNEDLNQMEEKWSKQVTVSEPVGERGLVMRSCSQASGVSKSGTHAWTRGLPSSHGFEK